MLGDGERWDGQLSPSATATLTFPFVRGLEMVAVGGAPSGTITPADWVQFISTDAAGNKSAAQQNNFASGTVPTPEAFTVGAPDLATLVLNSPAAAVNLCNGQGSSACATGDVKSVNVKARATGPTGTFANPFTGGTLYFYYFDGTDYNLLGSVAGSAGLISDTGTDRYYDWTFPITSADVADIANGTIYTVYMIAVDSDGDALMTEANANITIVDGA
jgi:hypothetical protein